MRNDKHLAIKLRKKGKSYNHISKVLEIPKSTMVYWFKSEAWSEEIKKELTRKANYVARKRLTLINKRRREEWEKWRQGFRNEAIREFPLLLKKPLFISGINLYWGEGDSNLKNAIKLSNTDPRMINLFSKFCQKILKVPIEKMYPWLILYPDLSEKKCKDFWSKTSGIPISNFKKTQLIKGKHPTKKLTYGICIIQMNSRGLKEKLFTWINLFFEKFKLTAGIV